MKMTCRKCGSDRLGIRFIEKGPHKAEVYCTACGAWQKRASPNEQRLFDRGDIKIEITIRAYTAEQMEELYDALIEALNSTFDPVVSNALSSALDYLEDKMEQEGTGNGQNR